MSLPPIAPPPSAAPRLQSRKQHQPSPPAAAPRKPMAVLATAPHAPGKPPRKGRGVPSERPAGFSSSWPSASLQKQLPRSRAAQGSRNVPPPERGAAAAAAAALSAALSRSRGRSGPPAGGTHSCESLSAAPGGRGEASLRFSLSLPPEAIRVLQRRSLEKQQRPRGRVARFSSPDASRCPLAGTSSPEGDLRALLQVSLLNERHRYDDVEYEEDEAAGDPGAFTADEGLVRKCTEWLRGVESAAARDRAGKMDSLPHLSTL